MTTETLPPPKRVTMPVKIFGIRMTKKVVATISTTLAGLLLWALQLLANAAWADHNRIAAQESVTALMPSVVAATQAESVNRQITALEIVGIKEDISEIKDTGHRIEANVFNLARRGGIPAATRPTVR